MDAQQNPTGLTPQQIKLVKFVASGKIDSEGNKWTIEKFCEEVLHMNRATYYDWMSKQEVRMAILDETMGRVHQFVPAMVQAQVAKAVKKQDTTAFMAVMRQAGVLKSDKIDHTTNGKDMPVPIGMVIEKEAKDA